MRKQRGHGDPSFITALAFWIAVALGCVGAAILAWGIYVKSHAKPSDHTAGLGRVGIGALLVIVAFFAGVCLA